MPISLKDRIWLSTAIELRKTESFELEKFKIEQQVKQNDNLLLSLADIREISLDTNGWYRAKLMGRQFKEFDRKTLPSNKYLADKKAKEPPHELTLEERQARIRALANGESVNFD